VKSAVVIVDDKPYIKLEFTWTEVPSFALPKEIRRAWARAMFEHNTQGLIPQEFTFEYLWPMEEAEKFNER
jgi:hypothetical protein